MLKHDVAVEHRNQYCLIFERKGLPYMINFNAKTQFIECKFRKIGTKN